MSNERELTFRDESESALTMVLVALAILGLVVTIVVPYVIQ